MIKYKSVAIDADAASDDGTFAGYGSVFGVADSWGDRVMPGAFAASLSSWREKGRMPKMLWQHQADQPVGVWETIEEDGRGLKMRGRLLIDALVKAREVHALLKAGAVDGLSIGYTVTGRKWNDEEKLNELTALNLVETSIVTFPSNAEAVIDEVKTGRETNEIRAALAIVRSIDL